jgi:hypothetical protein
VPVTAPMIGPDGLVEDGTSRAVLADVLAALAGSVD